ncbi:hypothetical protein N7509_013115 [Penicillium cosmopolitanum]|uniref:FAD-binding domain-containing protein n=1 Tax=Penicillium cosmopolitanum TaxID=1131564 RepID=A0A9W9SEN3_9EURO|nr:uncharacterized protein N7509_013115 [Penicillium cosmopolitanum]KAJ5376229.1 hypothetical protein N7509_013115 [Penicillium cosmopolitanum]
MSLAKVSYETKESTWAGWSGYSNSSEFHAAAPEAGTWSLFGEICYRAPKGIERRWEYGKVIGRTRLFPAFREQFDAPYWVVHKVHFLEAMHKLAVDLGVSIELASKVTSYDVHHPSITLATGSIIHADLRHRCRRVNSSTRKIVLGGKESLPQRTGFSAYRAVVDIKRIQNDPDVSWLLEKPSFNLCTGKSFNVVLNHEDLSDPADWRQDKDWRLSNMRKDFEGWDPVLSKIIGMIDKTMKWPLYSSSIMRRWVSGKLVVLGDAAHAMVPYMSQGSAIAVEDGVAIARCLRKVSTKNKIYLALSIFEKVRIRRASQMQEASLLNSKIWHFPDGPIQRARDQAMRPEIEDLPFSHSPNQWSNPATQMWCYGYGSF